MLNWISVVIGAIFILFGGNELAIIFGWSLMVSGFIYLAADSV